jgi:hypothetical protein
MLLDSHIDTLAQCICETLSQGTNPEGGNMETEPVDLSVTVAKLRQLRKDHPEIFEDYMSESESYIMDDEEIEGVYIDDPPRGFCE